MALAYTTVDDLVRIAVAGAGFKLDASTKTIEDLIKIAIAAKSSNATVTFYGLKTRTTQDLIRIGIAGKGVVIIED